MKHDKETIRKLLREVQFSDLSIQASVMASKDATIKEHALDMLADGLLSQLKVLKSYNDKEDYRRSRLKYAFSFDPSRRNYEYHSVQSRR